MSDAGRRRPITAAGAEVEAPHRNGADCEFTLRVMALTSREVVKGTSPVAEESGGAHRGKKTQIRNPKAHSGDGVEMVACASLALSNLVV